MVEQYHKPTTVQQALGLKRRFRDRAAFLAGGTMASARDSPLHPDHWISLEGLKLDRIELKRGDLIIGAFCSLQQLIDDARSPEVLRAAAAQIVSRNIRNMATIGGHVAANQPGSDLIPTLVALEAEVELPGPRAAKTISVMDYISTGAVSGITPGARSATASRAAPGCTSGCVSGCDSGCASAGAVGVASAFAASQPNLITRIILPRSPRDRVAACGNVRGSANARSVLSAAVSLTPAGLGIQRPIIALGGVSRHVIRLTSAEEALNGKPSPPIDKLQAMVSRCVRPASTPFASAPYLKDQAGVVVALAFREALRPKGDRG